MKRSFLLLSLAGRFFCVALLFTGCDREKQVQKPVLIEQTRDVAFVQSYTQGFDRMDLSEKILIYYLTQAAIAGDPVIYEQIHPQGYQIKLFLDGIITHSEGIKERSLSAIEEYAKLFWCNHGFYDRRTRAKFSPEIDRQALQEAVIVAISNGANVGYRAHVALNLKFDELEPVIYHPQFEPKLAGNINYYGIEGEGESNLYSGLNYNEVKGWEEKYPLNSRLKKSGNEITEEVYRAGNDMLPAGLYAQELMSVVDNIRLAENYSREAKELLEMLAQYFETGQTEFFSDYQKQWIRRDSTVDWSLGFFHADFDPRGIKGAFQGMVFIKNDEEQKLIDNLMLKIPELELESPCDPSFKQSEFPEIKIIAVDIITATGDAGYRIPEVVNFPDSEGFNLSGGKIVIFANVIEARWDLEFKRNLLFASNEEEMVLAQQYAREARTVFTILTETFGRLTAKSALGSQNKLGYLLPVVEEGIAQLSALWQLQNPKLCDWGIISNPEVALEGYQWWIREVMVNTVVHDDIGINEIAKSLAQRMIFNYLLARSQCLTLKSANGNTIYVLQDAEEMRRTVGELLQEMVRIRAEGDFLGASSLLKQYGTLFDASLIRELFQKILEAKLPLTIAVLTPEIKLVTTKMGKIKEVTIEYPEDVLKYGSDIAKRSFIVPETQKLENEILQRIEINE